MPAHEDHMFWDAEVLSANRATVFTDLLTIPSKNPLHVSVFHQLFLEARKKKPKALCFITFIYSNKNSTH